MEQPGSKLDGRALRALATTEQWRKGGETGDVDLCLEALAADVVIHSPISHRIRFEGRDQAHDLLIAAFSLFQELRYASDIGDHRNRTLVHRARIGEQELEEVQLIRLDDAAKISEITLFVRPLPALTALMSALGPELARQQGHARLAPLLAALTKPLAFMTKIGDRQIVPFVDPNRSGRIDRKSR